MLLYAANHAANQQQAYAQCGQCWWYAAFVDIGASSFSVCDDSYLVCLLLDGLPARAFQSSNAFAEAR